jgi:hypoxanthine phosphoribosyltransferase
MQSYDYATRKGVHRLTWDDFAALAGRLTEGLAPYSVDVIVGIARAGLFPATAVSCSLRRELYPVRVSRRVNDEVQYKVPVWRVPVTPEAVTGKVVVVMDEIADTGDTLALVAAKVLECGAARVITACLVRHTWADPTPDVCPLVTDALVIFPWDQQIYADGRWQPHPELVAALNMQPKADSDSPSEG